LEVCVLYPNIGLYCCHLLMGAIYPNRTKTIRSIKQNRYKQDNNFPRPLYLYPNYLKLQAGGTFAQPPEALAENQS
ncbi:hypothetical protein, partial [Vibrio vulnificus]|uniref:hypothetical protein n=1 Tax=Vibrio vulnificus TaxID=672 RepID=UPI0019D4768A